MNKDTLLLVCFYTVDNINLNEIKFSHLVCRTADRGGNRTRAQGRRCRLVCIRLTELKFHLKVK
jgi:hypothetical protein